MTELWIAAVSVVLLAVAYVAVNLERIQACIHARRRKGWLL